MFYLYITMHYIVEIQNETFLNCILKSINNFLYRHINGKS